ncbi:DUF2768 domain-containing protein [Chryseomicrobium palamuruense]|uniref:DUF2768 domain-containing protein n=1 Tax=Chryseomicrobium palamuruense TaxID=682973 RepID=A0ABV8UVT6_9BACL
MWVSFGSMGFMFIAMLIMLFVNTKIQNKVIAIPLRIIAWLCLVLGFLSMVYIIFNPTRGTAA